MKQAKTLNEKEIKSIFAQIATRRHSVRDRAIFAISFYAGLRAHEIASLNIDNIVNADGSIRDEIMMLRAKHSPEKLARHQFWAITPNKSFNTLYF